MSENGIARMHSAKHLAVSLDKERHQGSGNTSTGWAARSKLDCTTQTSASSLSACQPFVDTPMALQLASVAGCKDLPPVK